MAAAAQNIFYLFCFITIGFVLGRKSIILPAHAKALSAAGVYVFLPCTIFNSFAKSFTIDNLRVYLPLFGTSLAVLIALVLLSRPLSRLLAGKSYRADVFSYSMIVPNYGHAGYAMAEAVYGAEGLLHLILFSLPVSLFAYTGGVSKLTRKPLRLKSLYNPVTIALFAGILFGLSGLKLPHMATTFLSKSAACMAPTAMLLAGVTISEYPFGKMLLDPKALLVCLMRLLVIPVCLCLILKAVTDNTILIRTAVLFHAMPCGLNTIIFPKLVGEDCSTGASLCMLSNTLALLTLPLCLALL